MLAGYRVPAGWHPAESRSTSSLWHSLRARARPARCDLPAKLAGHGSRRDQFPPTERYERQQILAGPVDVLYRGQIQTERPAVAGRLCLAPRILELIDPDPGELPFELQSDLLRAVVGADSQHGAQCHVLDASKMLWIDASSRALYSASDCGAD